MMYMYISNSFLFWIYHIDLYGGILSNTLVEQRSIFCLFLNKASTRNVLWSKIDLVVGHISYFKFAARAIRPHFQATSGFFWNRSIKVASVKNAAWCMINVS